MDATDGFFNKQAGAKNANKLELRPLKSPFIQVNQSDHISELERLSNENGSETSQGEIEDGTVLEDRSRGPDQGDTVEGFNQPDSTLMQDLEEF